ncbi:hypothetical protein [Rhodococcus sp. KRD162]|nr:hypothetical protein [Rhodococcus sp. KRD162]
MRRFDGVDDVPRLLHPADNAIGSVAKHASARRRVIELSGFVIVRSS